MQCAFCLAAGAAGVAAAGWRLCCRYRGAGDSHWELVCARHGPARLELAA